MLQHEPSVMDRELPRQSHQQMETDEVCWICLDDGGHEALITPCKCPRPVHSKCLARWQLQQAGRLEETHCRFCNASLADWKSSLTPDTLKPEVPKVQPIMVVYFEGQIHRIPVKQGSDGLSEFTTRIRELFRLPEDIDISLTFGCKEPLSGQHLKLEGIGAFDAAVHCASVAAAERQAKLKNTSTGSTGNLQGLQTCNSVGSSSSASSSQHGAAAAADNTAPAMASGPSAPAAAQPQPVLYNHSPSSFASADSDYAPATPPNRRSRSLASSGYMPTPPPPHASPEYVPSIPPEAAAAFSGMPMPAAVPVAHHQATYYTSPLAMQPSVPLSSSGSSLNLPSLPSSCLPTTSSLTGAIEEEIVDDNDMMLPRRHRRACMTQTAGLPGGSSMEDHGHGHAMSMGGSAVMGPNGVPVPPESLTGRLKHSLKAFSKKVARSLSFKPGENSHSAAACMRNARAYTAGDSQADMAVDGHMAMD